VSLLPEGVQVQEVAEQLGYAQPSTFIAAFKRTVGMTPGAYAETLESVPSSASSAEASPEEMSGTS